MSGWIRIEREAFDHPVLNGGAMSRREAWFWLIHKAAWKDTIHRANGEVRQVPRGSMFLTLREMQAAWGWKSDTRVRKFLKALGESLMIVCETNAGKTQITICNYSRYQDAERTENAEKTQDERTENALKKQDNKKQEDIDTSLRSVSPRAEKPTLRKSRIVDGFTPNAAGLAAMDRAGIPDQEREIQISKFADYHAAKGSLMLDWQAAWRTWCGNYRQFGQPRAGPTNSPPRRRGSAGIFDALDKVLPDDPNDQAISPSPLRLLSSAG